MSSRRTRLKSANLVVMFAFVFLLAIPFRSAYASPAVHVVTAYGNAQIDTAQSKFGGASGLFDGTGDYLSLADSDDWNFGTGDFTIDFWVRFNALPGVGSIMQFCSQRVDANNFWILYFANVGGDYRWYFEVMSGGVYRVVLIRSTTVSTGVWYHIALVRSGSSWSFYQDGSQLGATLTDSDAVPDLAAELHIGEFGGWAQFNGWLDEFRVSKGVARWTSNFTPPTSAHVADLSTVLLLHMDGTDGSATFTDDSYAGPSSFSFSVKAGATQIVVTLTYSWSGSGSPPLGSITIAGPGGTPTLQESAAVVYDRTSITVSGGTSTYSIIHRVTFTIAAPGSAQTWTALVSLPGISSYNVAIEVS